MCGIAGHLNYRSAPCTDAVQNLVNEVPAGRTIHGDLDLPFQTLHSRPCTAQHHRHRVQRQNLYNLLSLRRMCEAQRDKFRTGTDTEVILALYRRHGIETSAPRVCVYNLG
jgi:hypothetical protein